MTIPLNFDKKLADYVIEKLRQALQQLTYLDDIYPAVKVGKREDGSTYPQVYIQAGNRKILDLSPDTSKKSYVFFEKNKTEVSPDGNIFDLSLIFWGQLAKIDDTKDYDFVSQIENDIIKILLDNGAFDIIIDEDRAFDKYNLHETQQQYLMYPYTAFRVDFSINCDLGC